MCMILAVFSITKALERKALTRILTIITTSSVSWFSELNWQSTAPALQRSGFEFPFRPFSLLLKQR